MGCVGGGSSTTEQAGYKSGATSCMQLKTFCHGGTSGEARGVSKDGNKEGRPGDALVWQVDVAMDRAGVGDAVLGDRPRFNQWKR